jgi:hypothetical protein
MLCVFYVLWVL